MELGIALPQFGRFASTDAIAAVATRAEALGLDALWVQERLLRPTSPKNGYGGMPGVPWPAPYATVFDPIETLTFAAAKTTRVKLGTSVIDAPFHAPIVMAKRLATLDQLSGGRVIAGLGQGWSEDEFASVAVPPRRRGAGFEEWIAAVRAAWAPDPVRFEGRFYRFTESEVGPKPVQAGGPPLVLAAFAPAAIERAARVGAGLNPIGLSWEMIEGALAGFAQAVAGAGRNRAELPVIVRANNAVSAAPLPEPRDPFSGTAEQVAEDLARAERMGVDQVFLDPNFAETPIDTQLRLLEDVQRIRRKA